MRKLTTLVLALLCLQVSLAQSVCPPNGISTDPANPVNPQTPALTNNFNWLQTEYATNKTCQPHSSWSTSPFHLPNGNTEFLFLTKDMKPVDGWELIKIDLGYNNAGAPSTAVSEHSYFILYNRFTGILRIFVKTCRRADYQAIKIKFGFSKGANFQTNLLDYTGDLKGLDVKHRRDESFAHTETFLNEVQSWQYADFPTNYDPCTCQYQSRLQVMVALVESAQIKLDGGITGTIATIQSGGGSHDNDGFNWKDVQNLNDKAQKAHKGIQNFVKNYDSTYKKLATAGVKIGAIKQLGDFMKTNSFMKAGLAAVPYVGEAVKFISGFIGGGATGSGPIQLAPMSVNLNVRLSGTITSQSEYSNFTLPNPGSLNATADLGNAPAYNEVLGVVTLLDNPKMYYKEQVSEIKHGVTNVCNSTSWFNTVEWYKYDIKRRTYKFDGSSIKYIINPASGLELQDAQMVLMAHYENPYRKYRRSFLPPGVAGSCFDTTDKGMDIGQGISDVGLLNPSTGLYQNASQVFNADCFSGNLRFSFLHEIVKKSGSQFLIPEALCYKNWPVNCLVGQVLPLPTRDYIQRQPLYPEWKEPQVKSFRLKIIFNLRRKDGIGQNVLYVAEYPVTLEAAPTTLPTNFFEAGDNLTSGICRTGFWQQASQSEVIARCESSVYKDGRITLPQIDSAAFEALPPNAVSTGVTLSPNPASSAITLKFGAPVRLLQVLNATGQSVMNLRNANAVVSPYTLDIHTLSPGVYFLQYSQNGKVSTMKFIVQR